MLRFTDGFDAYAATADLLKKWNSNSGWVWNATAGRTGGGAITLTASTGTLTMVNGTLTAIGTGNFYLAFWFKASAPPAALSTLLGFYGVSSNVGGSVRINPSGVLTTYASDNSGPNLTGTTNICDGNFHWVEIQITTGATQVTTGYVDGIMQWSGSPTNWGSASLTYLTVGINQTMTVTFDDLIVYDTAAGAPTTANFPMGPRQITTTRPSSDGACTFGTLSSGTTHFSLVNETTPDGDTSWVQDGISGHQDLYNYGALGYTPSSIVAVNVNNYLKNPAVGTLNFQNACLSGVTTGLGASTVTPVNYLTIQTPFAVDPNTSAAWTAAGLNAAQFGIRVP